MVACSPLTKIDFEKIRQLDTCTAANAIDRLGVRLRNEGSISGTALHCMFPNLPPILGYAVTGRMRSTSAPIAGSAYHENMNWWRYVASIPEPRVLVVEDTDEKPGVGALFGDVHASISLALDCVAYVTNGAVRDLPAVEALGFQLFAGNVAVAHMYAHISEFGEPIELGGLRVSPGDLIHGDLHGVHVIPFSVASEIPKMAQQIIAEECDLKEFCRSPQFSLDALERKLQHPADAGLETPVNGCPRQSMHASQDPYDVTGRRILGGHNGSAR